MTAVNWLDEQLQDTMYIQYGYINEVRKVVISLEDYMRLKKEAIELEKQQIIISDEDIEKGANECYPYDELLDDGLKGMIISAKKGAWFDAIKWYREQLKQRQ